MTDKIIRSIKTKDAPQAIGPYSQAVSIENLVFVSGQIPIDPDTGEINRGDIRDQTALVLSNTKNVLKASGLSLDRVVKVDIFLSDLRNFDEMNAVYENAFHHDVKPARCVVEVSRLPKDVGIEMSCIAYSA